MVVALDNGDVLKCNFQNILDENDNQTSETKIPKSQMSKNQPSRKGQSSKDQPDINRDKTVQGQNENDSIKGQGQGQTNDGETEGDGQEEEGEDKEKSVLEIETTKIYHPLLVPNVSKSVYLFFSLH